MSTAEASDVNVSPVTGIHIIMMKFDVYSRLFSTIKQYAIQTLYIYTLKIYKRYYERNYISMLMSPTGLKH